MSTPTANKKIPPRRPKGMPRYIKRGNVHFMLPPLDESRCWLLIRKLNPNLPDEELILTPACLDTDSVEEEIYMNFLGRFGWRNLFSIEGRMTSTGRKEYMWFPAPTDLTDPNQVIGSIEQLAEHIDGERLLDGLKERFRAGNLRLVLDLSEP